MEQEIDAQIEQLLSAKRTVRNIDAASAANVIGECSRIFWFPVVQKCTIPYILLLTLEKEIIYNNNSVICHGMYNI